jgi:hypothetical protein
MTWSANWAKFNSSTRFAGGAHRTATAGATLTFKSTGTRIYLVGDRGPDNGRFRVRIDGGSWSAWINSRATTAKVRQVLWTSPTLTDGAHTMKIAVEGTAGHPKVVVDGIAFRR